MLSYLDNKLKQKDAYEFSVSEELPIVNSFNEWDHLEEVIVGVVNGACIPSWDIAIDSVVPDNQKNFYKTSGGNRFSEVEVELAKKDLNEFIHILEAEGVTVKRPDVVDYKVPFSTMEWTSSSGFYAAMPRDTLLVVGNEIIEAPMAWRSRYFECNAYRNLLKDYFLKGSKWSAAPKPQLNDKLFNYDYAPPEYDQEMSYVISEYEPTFDAADFTRCGKDIFAQKSHVTNDFGIQWLQRHLGGDYTIHTIEVNDKHPMHIDATLVPLAPGKLLIHPDRITKIPEMFKSWDILRAPDPCISKNHPLYMTSRWLNMNILMLDHTRVMVEKDEETMINALKNFGLEPIPCPFKHFNTFGGSC